MISIRDYQKHLKDKLIAQKHLEEALYKKRSINLKKWKKINSSVLLL